MRDKRSFVFTVTIGLLLTACSAKTSGERLNLTGQSDTSTSGGTTSGSTGSTTGSTTGSSTGSSTSGSTGGSSSGTTSGASSFTCTATPSSLTVNSGGVVSVTIAASNGIAPYSIPQFVSSFSSQATISPTRTYINNTSSTIQDTRTVTIKDNAGFYTSCSFTVNVLSSSSPSYLGCVVTANPTNPIVGQPVTFTLKASNGSSNYSFSNFVAEASSGTSSISQNGSDTATTTYTYTYNSVGSRYAYATVTSGSSSSLCSAAQVIVRQPKLEIASNPYSGTTDVVNAITLTATPIGFASNAVLNYSYSTTEAGISVSVTGNILTVRSSNGQVHNFNLVVSASASTGETASITVPLKFTANTPICGIVDLGQLIMNVDYRMEVRAQNNEALEIYEFNPTGGLFSQDTVLTNIFYARFLTGGNKVIDGIKARSKVTHALCNGDGRVGAIVPNVKSRLISCSVSNGLGISKESEQVAVTATLLGGIGPYHVTATSIGADIVQLQPNQLGMRYFTAGTYTINLTVVDLYDNSSKTCQAQQTVTENSGISASLYNTSSKGWNYRFTDGITNYPLIQNVTLGAFHIYNWFIGNFPGTNTKEWFVVQMKTRLNISTTNAGDYRLYMTVDDGIRVTIDGRIVMLSDTMQPATNATSDQYLGNVPINLTAGMHDMVVDYYNGGGHQTFNLRWSGPNTGGYTQIPADIMYKP